MAKLSKPHDKFFKETFSQPKIVRDFVRNYLPPDIVARLDLDALELQKDSFIEGLQEHFSDILYRVRLKSGATAFLYFLFEHKSYPDKWSSLQLLRYMVQIWEQMVTGQGDDGGKRPLKLTPILPIILHHGEQRWNISREFNGLFDQPTDMEPYIPNFHYELVDLSQASDETVRGLAETRFVLDVMRYIRSDVFFEELVRMLQLIQLSEDDKLASYLIGVAVYYMMQYRNDLTVDALRKAAVLADLPQGDETMTTLAERLRHEGFEQGVQQGVQQGMQQGVQQGMQANILQLLHLRFQTVPSGIITKLTAIQDSKVLSQLLETTVTAASLDEFDSRLRSYAY